MSLDSFVTVWVSEGYVCVDRGGLSMRLKRLLFGVGFVAVMLGVAVPASATVGPIGAPGRAGSNTEMTMSGTGAGQAVAGFIANPGSGFDPVSAGYPVANPVSGFSPLNEGFAGIIRGTPADGSAPLSLYCIDIRTSTYPGLGYALGSWDASQVPNVGYVARILNSYFPTVPTAPPGLANDNQRAAATQAAIWFFSDSYVLNTSDPLHDTVAAIATAVIASGPLDQPPPPSLTITPTTAGAPAGTAVGPFTVTSSAPATVAAVGASMSTDAAGTQPLADGSTIGSGTSIWLTSTGPDVAVLLATAVSTVPTGNVYLYDGNTGGVHDAQKLILAQTSTLRTTVRAQADFQPPGSLTVTKTIAGTAAGQQGTIVIVVTCDGVVQRPSLVIPAGTPAGTTSQTYTNIPAGSACTVVETSDGHTPTVTVQKPRSGQVVVVPPGGSVAADLVDTYDSGSLVVSKTITGTAAGQQGQVTISVNCGGTALADFIVPAGTPAGTVSQTYPNLIAGTVCTITETADGSTATVIASTIGSPQQVTIAANGSGTANIVDGFEPASGTLVLTKTITGGAAGQQGPIGILVACGGPPHVYVFRIEAAAGAGSGSQSINDLPGGATCVVVEALNGTTNDVVVVGSGSPQLIPVPVAGEATASLTNNVEAVPATTTTTTLRPDLPATGTTVDARTPFLAIAALGVGGLLILISRRRRAHGG